MKNYIQFKLGENSESLFIDLKLSEKQKHYLNNLKTDKDKLNYLISFSGIRTKTQVDRHRSYDNDELQMRYKNHFFNLMRSSVNVTSSKKPILKDFHFGIEIECQVPYDSVGADRSGTTESDCPDCEGSGTLDFTNRHTGHTIDSECPTCNGTGTYENENEEHNGVDCLQDYLKSKAIKGIHVKSDSSIDEDDDLFGSEIAVLTSDFKNLKKLCDELNDLNTEVNESCGLHVHLDVRQYLNDSERLDTIKYNMELALPILMQIVPESRRDNTYCANRVSDLKYSAFNTGTISRLGTIECRLHSGTTNFTKIKNWCEILKAIVDLETSKPDIKLESIEEFCSYFKINDDLKNYMIERKDKFNV